MRSKGCSGLQSKLSRKGREVLIRLLSLRFRDNDAWNVLMTSVGFTDFVSVIVEKSGTKVSKAATAGSHESNIWVENGRVGCVGTEPRSG